MGGAGAGPSTTAPRRRGFGFVAQSAQRRPRPGHGTPQVCAAMAHCSCRSCHERLFRFAQRAWAQGLPWQTDVAVGVSTAVLRAPPGRRRSGCSRPFQTREPAPSQMTTSHLPNEPKLSPRPRPRAPSAPPPSPTRHFLRDADVHTTRAQPALHASPGAAGAPRAHPPPPLRWALGHTELHPVAVPGPPLVRPPNGASDHKYVWGEVDAFSRITNRPVPRVRHTPCSGGSDTRAPFRLLCPCFCAPGGGGGGGGGLGGILRRGTRLSPTPPPPLPCPGRPHSVAKSGRGRV